MEINVVINIICSAAAAAKSLQSCLTLCDPRDGSPPGCPVPGILQARTLEWVAISFSNEWKWKVKVKSLSRVWLLATPWTAAYQAPPPMGFSRQEYWSGVPAKREVVSLLKCIKSVETVVFWSRERVSLSFAFIDQNVKQLTVNKIKWKWSCSVLSDFLPPHGL